MGSQEAEDLGRLGWIIDEIVVCMEVDCCPVDEFQDPNAFEILLMG